ncbi:hypothetical protein K438DRAFT_1776679 [Mycena galopus ATCC 62051]|nr:hypothetical protein K438DRAFT_1776679 [Mycena galopus ATCC 62051]
MPTCLRHSSILNYARPSRAPANVIVEASFDSRVSEREFKGRTEVLVIFYIHWAWAIPTLLAGDQLITPSAAQNGQNINEFESSPSDPVQVTLFPAHFWQFFLTKTLKLSCKTISGRNRTKQGQHSPSRNQSRSRINHLHKDKHSTIRPSSSALWRAFNAAQCHSNA